MHTAVLETVNFLCRGGEDTQAELAVTGLQQECSRALGAWQDSALLCSAAYEPAQAADSLSPARRHPPPKLIYMVCLPAYLVFISE